MNTDWSLQEVTPFQFRLHKKSTCQNITSKLHKKRHTSSSCNKERRCSIDIICDDNDVFLLRTHHYHSNINILVVMEETSAKSIPDRVIKRKDMNEDLLAAQTLTKCDLAVYMWGIGKTTAIKILTKGHRLKRLVDEQRDISVIVDEAIKFVVTCYEHYGYILSDVRYQVWLAKTGKRKVITLPALRSFPITTEA